MLQFKEHTAVVAAFVAYESEKCLELQRPWLLAAKAGKGKVLFVKIDVSVPDFQMQHIVNKYHFKHPPLVIVIEKGQKKGIPMKESPTEENLVALAERLKSWTPKITPKEPKAVPIPDTEPPVLTASGKSEL